MDNKALADFIRVELSKLSTVINKLASKIALLHAPREQNAAGVAPHNTSSHENDSAGGQVPLPPQIPPSPTNSPQSQNTWYKTMNGWKTFLEIIAIPFAILYAIVSWSQWRDLQHNFEVDQRAWLNAKVYLPEALRDDDTKPSVEVVNIGKNPALKSAIDVAFEIVNASRGPSLTFATKHHATFIATLFPADHTPVQVTLTPDNEDGSSRKMTTTEIESLASGDAYIVIFGQIIYLDVFGLHWTRFCVWRAYPRDHGVKREFQASSCVAYNSVGDGTPPK